MGRRCLLTLALVVVGAIASAQPTGLEQRHWRIGELYQAERYAEMVREVEQQLIEAPGTTYGDSLHRYLYKFARGKLKTAGPDASVAAGERVWTLVARHVKDPGHRLDALADLSWVYSDIGRPKECIRVDSMALVLARAHAAEVGPTKLGNASHYLGFDHSTLGDHATALRHFLEAHRVFSSAAEPPRLHLAEASTAIGSCYWHLGRSRDAERYYDEALELLGSDTTDEGKVRQASALGNLGILFQDAGDLPRSKLYYQRGIDLHKAVAVHTDELYRRDEAIMGGARGYLNLASVYFSTGDLRKARELLEISLRERLRVLEPDDPQVLRLREFFADIEADHGAFDKAEELLRTYATGCASRYGENNVHYASACAKLASVLGKKGDVRQADSLFAVSLDRGRIAVGERDPQRAVTLQLRAQMYMANGRYQEAMADVLQARNILVGIAGPRWHKVAATHVQLAEAAYLKGDLAEAARQADTALVSLQDRVVALKGVPKVFPKPHLLADATYWKVRSERAQGTSAAQEMAWTAELEVAIASLQQNRTVLSDEASRLLLIGTQKRLFDLALDIAYDRYARTKAPADLQRFLDLSEADRAILLKGRLNAFSGLRFAGVPDAVIAREQQLLKGLEIDPDDPTTAHDLHGKEQSYAAFLDTLLHTYPRYYALRYGDERLPLAEVRKRLLAPGRDLLVYAASGDRFYALVLRQDTSLLLRLESATVPAAVQALNAAVIARDPEGYVGTAQELHRQVFAPVSAWLTGDELLIVPDGALHTVNFEVLLEAPATPKDFRQHLLLRRFAMAQLLSVTTAVQFARLGARKDPSVLAMAPGFTDELKQDYLAQVRDSAHIDRTYLHLARQPFAVRTAEELGQRMSANVLLGAAATEQRFRDQAVKHGVLHLGTHAEMNAAAPMFSRFMFSKDSDTSRMDGYLHAYEIYELELRAELAVLTACETGAGRNDDGEGIRSLGHAFAYAGCPSLVVSLWKIDEKTSADIITRFYTYLAKGMPKHKALQQAKLDHLATVSDELAQPYYWAGVVLVGDIGPLPLSFWKRYGWWIAGALVLLVGVLWIVRRRRAR